MEKLRNLRIRHNFTQQDIAKELGISQQAYANYENSNRVPPVKTLEKIASIFNISLETLLSTIESDELQDETIEEFLNKSYTSFHATKNTKTLLKKYGFSELKENELWDIKEGGKYFITKNDSAVIAFVVGDLNNYVFNIASCHTDSPCLKVKGNSLIPSPEGNRINVEKYGGLILYSMFDIPLKVAGRVFLKEGNSIKSKLISSDFNVNIPSLCIHHNITVNSDFKPSIQKDMLPLIGNCQDLYKTLLPNKNILDADLYCVPCEKPRKTGLNSEYLVSPRIDNLTSLYSIIRAISTANHAGISILYATDNEEVGSLSKQGAESSFVIHVLRRINSALNKNENDYYLAIANGFLVSIDNGHAVHPAHPEKSDPDQKVLLNKGIVIKHHPNYSTDGYSSSVIKSICEDNKIEYQDYYNNSDVRCGSTIGLVTSAQLAMHACDIGIAQLAMHSAIETAGFYDINSMTKLVKGFFESKIR